MDCLAGKQTAPYAGEVYLNGTPVDAQVLRANSSYVPWQDCGQPLATILEELQFTSKMKAQGGLWGLRAEEWAQQAQAYAILLDAVGLAGMGDCLLGDGRAWGISRGQRRRFMLCKGLVTTPSIVFMDDPISCLSTAGAEKVMQCCQLLCKASTHSDLPQGLSPPRTLIETWY